MDAARLTSLYRYPVKGFTPERRPAAHLSAGAGFPCDRLFAVENGPSGFDPEAPAFTPKTKFVVLASLPATARARTLYDEATGQVRLALPEGGETQHDLGAPEGRAAFAARLEPFFDAADRRGPFKTLRHESHRFTDHPRGAVSLINLASVRDLAGAAGVDLDPLRFRGNLYVEGWPAFAETDFAEGTRLRIGGAELEVFMPITRCAAVEVDPSTGVRDLDLVKTLFDLRGRPCLGLYLAVTGSGDVQEGDVVEIF